MLVKLLATAILGTGLGLAATYYVMGHGINFDEVKAGAWTRWPKAGAPDIDPYAHAILARSGQMPLGTGEGLAFFSWADGSGRRFQSNCDYIVKGPVPPARYWTLTLYTPSGALADNPAKRYGFTSSEILRAADGTFEIAVSQKARPGNWLPVTGNRSFALVLRLYDTLFDFGMAKVEATALPQIAKVRCE